jgi:hypothetical protein
MSLYKANNKADASFQHYVYSVLMQFVILDEIFNVYTNKYFIERHYQYRFEVNRFATNVLCGKT